LDTPAGITNERLILAKQECEPRTGRFSVDARKAPPPGQSSKSGIAELRRLRSSSQVEDMPSVGTAVASIEVAVVRINVLSTFIGVFAPIEAPPAARRCTERSSPL
jgi:hypothetical protein